MILIGVPPRRIDIDVFVGSPIDLTIPVLDDDNSPADALTDWTVTAQVYSPLGQKIDLTAVIESGGGSTNIHVSAAGTETATWSWAGFSAPWDVVLTDPLGSSPPPLCRGWVRMQPTVNSLATATL